MRRILFEKLGPSVWMSHLDTMRLMQRAFRRAGVLLHHSQGYTPHAYVSMPMPLSVGTESLCEIMEYELDTDLAISAEQLNAVLPEGVRVLSVYESPLKIKHLSRLQAQLRLFYDEGISENAVSEIAKLLSQESIVIEKRTKRGMEETDIRPLLHSATIKREGHTLVIDCEVSAQNPPLNPMLLVSAIETHLPQLKPNHAKCRRIEIFDAEGHVFR